MKKVLLSAFAGLCIIGASVATTNKTGTRIASRQTLTDTIPRDTSRPSRPDTMSPRMAFVQGNFTVTDTIPSDTTKPNKLDLGVAYVR